MEKARASRDWKIMLLYCVSTLVSIISFFVYSHYQFKMFSSGFMSMSWFAAYNAKSELNDNKNQGGYGSDDGESNKISKQDSSKKSFSFKDASGDFLWLFLATLSIGS